MNHPSFMSPRIFLDNNSTSALDPRVLEAMAYDFGPLARNPSSIHSFGQEARNKLVQARRTIAEVLEIDSDELIFTSGASESNNHLLRGFAKKIFPKKIVSTAIEHSSIHKNLLRYREKGGEVVFLPVDHEGAPKLDDLKKEIERSETALLVFMAANNETGVKTDIEAFAELAHHHHIPFIVDAVAWIGKEPFKLTEGISAITLSGHKFHGPKGIGLTYLSREYEIEPLILGGGQEKGHRSGTNNLAGALGLAKAFEIIGHCLPHETLRMQNLRDHFERELQKRLENVFINGTNERICNTSCLAFKDLDGESLLMNLDLKGVACSHGTACSSGSLAPSRVLSEMGYAPEHCRSSLRFALSRMTTQQEIDQAIDLITEVVEQMRAIV